MNGFLFAGIASDTAKAFGVNWPHFIAQALSFALVAFLLHRFAYKRVLAMLEERRQRIAESLEKADQIITKAREAAAQDHARMLVELKREVGRLVVQTTATVTGKVLTPDDQKRISEETAKQLGSAK